LPGCRPKSPAPPADLQRRRRRQIEPLQAHYRKTERLEALLNLRATLRAAERRIVTEPSAGQPAPRPYPEIARPGWAWIAVGLYWVAYSTTNPPVILAVFYATADIPGRL